MTFSYPEHLSLAQPNTPLQPLPRLSEKLHVELLTKRDDMTGLALSGNKVRKLEFLLADAIRQGADVVVTGGGEQSNHCRATALAATRLGLGCHLLLRTADPESPPTESANILLNRLAGAHIQWIDHKQWENRTQLFDQASTELRSKGRSPYVIPEGGSNALGSWGYVRAIQELARQLENHCQRPTTLVYACGSGGTGAGLVLGNRLHGLGLRIVGVNVCNSARYFKRHIRAICADFEKAYLDGPKAVTEDEIEILDGYVGPGYAQATDEQLGTIVNVARAEGLLLDPVYSGKAFHAMVTELEKNPKVFGERVIFLHTGGAFGLFAHGDRLLSLAKSQT